MERLNPEMRVRMCEILRTGLCAVGIALTSLSCLPVGCAPSGAADLGKRTEEECILEPADREEFAVVSASSAPEGRGGIGLKLLGRYQHGSFSQSAAEICAYQKETRRLYVVNAEAGGIDILDVVNPEEPKLVKRVVLTEQGSKPNSVAVWGNLVAAAMSSDPIQEPGKVVFLGGEGEIRKVVMVGAQPDMVTFSPDGKWLLTANEGEPSDDYQRDPEGSVSLIDVSGGVEQITQEKVKNLGFEAFHERSKLDPRVRVYGPGASVAQDLEPEYIAVSPDSKRAWVSLQEANGLGVIDLEKGEISQVVGLGFKDHSREENSLDASDKDGGIRIQSWPVKGMYQPDGIKAFASGDEVYLISANEGDHRKYSGFSEEVRVGELTLDPQRFPRAKELQKKEALGRLLVTKSLGDANGDGIYEELYSLGGRSFSIWSHTGELVWDSGNEFERILAGRYESSFNADQTSNERDGRSDNKGPEPEGVVVGEVGERKIAFIGLERHSGIMLYDVTDPKRPEFVEYALSRDISKPPETLEAGDLGPEGLTFLGAGESPTGKPILAVSYEVSGTTALYEVTVESIVADASPQD